MPRKTLAEKNKELRAEIKRNRESIDSLNEIVVKKDAQISQLKKEVYTWKESSQGNLDSYNNEWNLHREALNEISSLKEGIVSLVKKLA